MTSNITKFILTPGGNIAHAPARESSSSSSGANAGSSGDTIVFQDKRNRNPNWTDQEIIRFLEILQEEDTMKDLMAQRNKQVQFKIKFNFNSNPRLLFILRKYP